MKILQSKESKWYLDKQRIVSASLDLDDVIYCQECLLYSTMRQYHVVMESYEETVDWLMGCYVAFIRFHEHYVCPTRYIWVNKDADIPFFDNMLGQRKHFLGKVRRHHFKQVKEEIRAIGGRSVVIKQDWYIQFRDMLILTCY
jgi:hypothetical protein